MRDDHPDSIDIPHTTLSVLFIALLIASAFWVLRPFLTAIIWASIIAVATWPLLTRLEAVLGGRRGYAVAIMTTLILLVILVPLTLALTTIVRNAGNVTTEIRSLESIVLTAPPVWLERIPVVGGRLSERWRGFAALGPEERTAMLTPYVQTALQWFATKAGSVGTMLLQFLLTTVIAAMLFTKGEIVKEGVLRFARRLAGQQGHDAAILAARAIRSVVLGVVATAIAQAAIGGAGLFFAGVPGAALLTAAMLFLCLAQLGPLLVLVPAVAWLYFSGATAAGTALLVLAVFAGALDNVIRPLLIKRGADLPLALIFSGVIGGLLAFGIVGLFIGPVVLAVSYTLLNAWVSSGRHRDATTGETLARLSR